MEVVPSVLALWSHGDGKLSLVIVREMQVFSFEKKNLAG